MDKILNVITKNTLELIFSILGTEIIYYSLYRQFNIWYALVIVILNMVFFCFYDNILKGFNEISKIYIVSICAFIAFMMGLIKFEEYNNNISYSTWIFNGGSLIGKSFIYESVTLIFSTLIFSAMFFYFTIKVLKEHILILLVFIVLIMHMKCMYNRGNIFIYLFIGTFIGILLNRNKSNKRNKNNIFILIIASFFMLGAYNMPIPKSLPSIKPLQNLKEYFSVGINSSDERGFNVELNKNRNISESTSENPDTVIYSIFGSNPYYLINHNFDEYIDNEWKLDNNELYLGKSINKYDVDIPIQFTISKLSKSNLEYIISANNDDSFNKMINLRSCNYITSQLSHPANIIRCQINGDNEDIFLNGYDMLFNRNVDYFPSDNLYTMFFTSNNPKLGSKEDLIMKYFNEDRYKRFLEQVCSDKEKQEILDDINESTSPYTSIHKNISKDIRKLSKDITKDYESNYDKALAIEKYLKSEPYVYDLSIPESTNSDDYINYFILQGKRGYCIQYATAMTIMCRTLKIPARYVEGYLVSEEQSEDNEYEVKESDAHAFVEVYIPGFGWKIFDPTPSLEDDIFSKENSNINYFKYCNGMNYSNIIKYIFIIILLITFIYILVKVTKRYRIIKKITKKENEEALEEIIRYSIILLKELNIEVMDGETEMQFASRVLLENDIDILKNIKDYYRYKYNNEKVSRSNLKEAIFINEEIYKKVKKARKQKIIKKLKVIRCLKR
ncbi:MAG: transglutaminase domain-containing protein [Clostridiales bacterium]|nr:transglutaminase domain-containing protein [Clostridiales bacterium]